MRGDERENASAQRIAKKTKSLRVLARRLSCSDHRVEDIFALGKPGSDLLSQVLRLSTIGAGKINGRVRDGIGYRPPANTTRPTKGENSNPPPSRPLARTIDCGRIGETSLVFGFGFAFLDLMFVLTRAHAPACRLETALKTRAIKSIELLGPVSSTPYGAYTPGLSTWWSTTALFRENSF